MLSVVAQCLHCQSWLFHVSQGFHLLEQKLLQFKPLSSAHARWLRESSGTVECHDSSPGNYSNITHPTLNRNIGMRNCSVTMNLIFEIEIYSIVWCSHNAILAFANNLSGFCRFLQHKPNLYWLNKDSAVRCWNLSTLAPGNVEIHLNVSRFILQYSNQLKWKVFSKVCLVDLLRKAKAIC